MARTVTVPPVTKEVLVRFIKAFGATVLNIRPWDMILVKKNIIQLAHIDHFPAVTTLIEVPFF
jgi:hypothetical protein